MVKTLCREQFSVMTEIKKEVPDIYILKCYCHSFHLVAEHACKTQSKTAESLVHDVYNYFKSSPNRQNSFSEFQVFTQTEPHKLLCPSQTRWLSLQQCVSRILEQWTALELFFQAEFSEAKNLQSKIILKSSFSVCKSNTEIYGFCPWIYLQLK